MGNRIGNYDKRRAESMGSRMEYNLKKDTNRGNKKLSVMELSVVPNHGANTEDAVETDRLNQLPGHRPHKNHVPAFGIKQARRGWIDSRPRLIAKGLKFLKTSID